MSVYVDKTKNEFRGMIMCHMVADTLDELHAMAKKLGMKRSWFQSGSIPHYDVSLSKRRMAIEFGAIELDRKDFVMFIRKQREDILRKNMMNI